MAKLIGTDPNQVPTNADLGDMAYKNGDNLKAGPLTVVDESVSIGGQAPTTVFDINVERPIGTTIRLYGSNNSGAQTLYESFNGKDFRVGIENSSGSLGYGSAAYDRYLFSEGSFPITFSTDSTERMRIDGNGRVTMPYQPAFQAYNPQGQYITGVTEAAFNSTYSNVGGHYNTSTGRFTAPVSGNYFFHFDALIDGITGGQHFSLRKNGIEYNGSEAYHNGTEFNVAKAMVYYLAASDYVSVFLDTANSRIHQRYGSFCGYLIG